MSHTKRPAINYCGGKLQSTRSERRRRSVALVSAAIWLEDWWICGFMMQAGIDILQRPINILKNNEKQSSGLYVWALVVLPYCCGARRANLCGAQSSSCWKINSTRTKLLAARESELNQFVVWGSLYQSELTNLCGFLLPCPSSPTSLFSWIESRAFEWKCRKYPMIFPSKNRR